MSGSAENAALRDGQAAANVCKEYVAAALRVISQLTIGVSRAFDLSLDEAVTINMLLGHGMTRINRQFLHVCFRIGMDITQGRQQLRQQRRQAQLKLTQRQGTI